MAHRMLFCSPPFFTSRWERFPLNVRDKIRLDKSLRRWIGWGAQCVAYPLRPSSTVGLRRSFPLRAGKSVTGLGRLHGLCYKSASSFRRDKVTTDDMEINRSNGVPRIEPEGALHVLHLARVTHSGPFHGIFRRSELPLFLGNMTVVFCKRLCIKLFFRFPSTKVWPPSHSLCSLLSLYFMCLCHIVSFCLPNMLTPFLCFPLIFSWKTPLLP